MRKHFVVLLLVAFMFLSYNAAAYDSEDDFVPLPVIVPLPTPPDFVSLPEIVDDNPPDFVPLPSIYPDDFVALPEIG